MNLISVSKGDKFTIRVATNTISRVTYAQDVEVVWVEDGHVHYRKDGNSMVYQTPMDRFLDIITNQPREWH